MSAVLRTVLLLGLMLVAPEIMGAKPDLSCLKANLTISTLCDIISNHDLKTKNSDSRTSLNVVFLKSCKRREF